MGLALLRLRVLLLRVKVVGVRPHGRVELGSVQHQWEELAMLMTHPELHLHFDLRRRFALRVFAPLVSVASLHLSPWCCFWSEVVFAAHQVHFLSVAAVELV